MTKSKEENSYRNILKGTSIFGGVQVFQILINLIRGKFVAVLLGPEGMGIASLFSSASGTLQQLASLGLNLAIVKEVAASREEKEKRDTIIAIARKVIWMCAIAGTLICLFMSPLLSRWTFGSEEYTLGFIMLSAAVGLGIAGAGELSLLQGMHAVKRLSKASVVGSITGLVGGVPLYYFFGNAGIVPAMVLIATTTFLFYFFSVKRHVEAAKVKFAWSSHKPIVKKLIGMGLVLMAGALIGSLTTYLINAFIRGFGSLDDVGFYQAANSVTNQYVGVVFSAMALDFFPRLTAISGDNARLREVVNRQTEVVSLIMTPLITGLILTSPVIIQLLLTDRFMEIMPLMRWFGLGILIRGLNYPMGYIAFAKDNKRLFFWLEGITGNLLNLIFSCTAFYFFGLNGLGISFVVVEAATFMIYYIVNARKYQYGYSSRTRCHAVAAMLCGSVTFLCSFIADSTISYLLMGVLFLTATIVSGIKIKNILLSKSDNERQ